MISRDGKYLFIHVPKTAGESIEQYLLKGASRDPEVRSSVLLSRNYDPRRGPPRIAHLLAREYVRYGYVGEKEFDECFKFAFVRNPWARLVSEFFFNHYGHTDFRGFLLNRFPTPEDDDYETGSDRYRHVLPQYEFLHDERGNLLVDYVGRFESLDSDFAQVCRQLGIEAAPLPRVNTFSEVMASVLLKRGKIRAGQNIELEKPHYSRFYDDETRAWVERHYAKDIQTFNYTFEECDDGAR